MPIVTGSSFGSAIDESELSYTPMVVDTTSTTTADAQNITITGLDLNSSGMLLLIVRTQDNSGAGVTYRLYVNGDTTDGNYDCEETVVINGATTDTHFDYPNVGGAMTDTGAFLKIWIVRDVEGYVRIICHSMKGTTTGIRSAQTMIIKSDSTESNVTSLTLNASAANGLKTGTQYWVMRVS